MKRPLLLLFLLALGLTACGPATPSATPSVTPTQSAPSPSPTPSESPTTPTNSNCNEIAFYLDPALASDYTCETVPAEIEPPGNHPELTRITLMGYKWTGRIYVTSVADYTALWPTGIPRFVAELQGWTSSSTPPVFPAGGMLPILPFLWGMPAFFAQYGVVPFSDGVGIRYITTLGFEVSPIGNNLTMYTYQALTADGQYWVSAFLPIRNTILPDNEHVLPDGMTWDQFVAGYEPYILNIVQQLNTQPPGTFEPLIADLDALVSSITFVP